VATTVCPNEPSLRISSIAHGILEVEMRTCIPLVYSQGPCLGKRELAAQMRSYVSA
jgi:hypothetical protein